MQCISSLTASNEVLHLLTQLEDPLRKPQSSPNPKVHNMFSVLSQEMQ